MAPASILTVGQIKKLEGIAGKDSIFRSGHSLLTGDAWAEFATDLLSRLPNSHDSSSNDVLLSDLNHHISSVNALVEQRTLPTREISRTLREIARELWNECIKGRRKRDDILSSSSRILLQVRARVLAFLIHALARDTRNDEEQDFVEILLGMMGMSLTLARVCVESSDLDGALLSMTKAADYIGRLKKSRHTSTEDTAQIQKIEAEYFAMRCALVSPGLYTANALLTY